MFSATQSAKFESKNYRYFSVQPPYLILAL